MAIPSLLDYKSEIIWISRREVEVKVIIMVDYNVIIINNEEL